MAGSANRLGLEMLTLLGMNPVEQVRLAGELGFASVSLGLASMDLTAFGYSTVGLHAPWSLSQDAELRRELAAALADTGVRITLGEGFMIRPDQDIATRGADLDIMAELGAERINAISIEHDLARTHDQLAKLCELVTGRGMRFIGEFAPMNPVNSLPMALAAADYVGADRCGVMIDTMHFFRSGGTLEDLRALAPGRVQYAQLCDVPLRSPGMPYKEEAIFQRLAPGEGELPLRELLDLLPPDLDVGLEVPDRAALERGTSPRDHAARVVKAARALGY